jgi:hypothetical protein
MMLVQMIPKEELTSSTKWTILWIGSSKTELVLLDSETTQESAASSTLVLKTKTMLESTGLSLEDVTGITNLLRLISTFRYTTTSTLTLEALKN